MTTIATQRVIDLLKGAQIPYVSPIPDVVFTMTAYRGLVRALMAPLPHYMKYLDRNHCARRIRLLDGAVIYKIGRGDDIGHVPVMIGAATHEVVGPITSSDPLEIRGIARITPMVGMATRTYSSRHQEWNGSSWNMVWGVPTVEDVVRGSATTFTTRRFGGTLLGRSQTTAWGNDLGPSENVSEDYIDRTGASRWVGHGPPTDIPLLNHNGTALNEEYAVPDTVLYDVVCGPVCFEYGEIWPDFAFFTASGADVATRMRSVLDACTPKQTPSGDLEKGLAGLVALTAPIVTFRPNGIEPDDVWHDLTALGGRIEALPTDEDFTEADRAEVLSRWNERKWFVSIGVSDSSNALLFTDASETAGGVRASYRPDGIHMSTTKGTIKIEHGSAYASIMSLRRDGVAVTNVTPALSIPPELSADEYKYKLFASAFDDPIVTTAGSVDSGTVQRAFMGALTIKPIVESEESRPLLSLVTPQTFWATSP